MTTTKKPTLTAGELRRYRRYGRFRRGITGQTTHLRDRPIVVLKVGWTYLRDPIVTIACLDMDPVPQQDLGGGVTCPRRVRWLEGWIACRPFMEVPA